MASLRRNDSSTSKRRAAAPALRSDRSSAASMRPFSVRFHGAASVRASAARSGFGDHKRLDERLGDFQRRRGRFVRQFRGLMEIDLPRLPRPRGMTAIPGTGLGLDAKRGENARERQRFGHSYILSSGFKSKEGLR